MKSRRRVIGAKQGMSTHQLSACSSVALCDKHNAFVSYVNKCQRSGAPPRVNDNDDNDDDDEVSCTFFFYEKEK